MGTLHQSKLMPVLRRPRRAWQIPTSDLFAPSEEQQEKEAALKAFAKGTTPYGREIFRRILDLAARRLQANERTVEVIKEVADEIATFRELHAEFALLLARTMEVDPVELGRGSPFGWATQLVLWNRLMQKAEAEQAAQGESEDLSEPGAIPNPALETKNLRKDSSPIIPRN